MWWGFAIWLNRIAKEASAHGRRRTEARQETVAPRVRESGDDYEYQGSGLPVMAFLTKSRRLTHGLEPAQTIKNSRWGPVISRHGWFELIQVKDGRIAQCFSEKFGWRTHDRWSDWRKVLGRLRFIQGDMRENGGGGQREDVRGRKPGIGEKRAWKTGG